ncbi:MAG: DUF4040 domain-containing protein [Alphaproteobacteria bacterium]|jgi:multicomponent Na+:H+ antiporter subunit B|nr:DUF4040 domain-containing protein [Rhodospirillaceae bacterium]MBT6204552.1 DUF4040 domain-containing protein [Rhodospirillaceae bacterium]MBT7614462.1 DUF4040 domain-containing protein [Rhodospirillaceae bacterium]MBT7645635.1 DUF4040 domain-containing protein [Rhodospirillaceae bacterium]MDG2481851.1 DUF4040 domain-containing protein [Alphaproteobacteria bacterium]
MEKLHVVILLMLMISLALTVVRLRSLLAIAILSGVYSLILAVAFTLLDAVDVAFTEAAVGAGITLTLMLAALSLTTRSSTKGSGSAAQRSVAIVVCLMTGAALAYASLEMPAVGDFAAPIHGHVANRYIAEGPLMTGVPNIVTDILASYRGYDTLGEVTVIFTAGIAVMALLWRWRSDGK